MAGKIVRPPPLPHDTFQRVVQLSGFHGRMVLTVAGTFALFTAVEHQAAATICGLLAAGVGSMEMHGSHRLRAGFRDGIDWMVTAQIGMMLVLFGYAGWNLTHFDVNAMLRELPDQSIEAMKLVLTTRDLPESDLPVMLRATNTLVYSLLALISFFYQGAFALYYHRRRSAIAAVLEPSS